MTSPLPAIPAESSARDQALYAFLVEKGNRSGSRRTVESHSRMLWRFFEGTTPDRVRPADVLAYARGVGLSGRLPSAVTIGARIACLSSYFRFLIRMGLATSNPCDLVECPRQSPSPRGSTPPRRYDASWLSYPTRSRDGATGPSCSYSS